MLQVPPLVRIKSAPTCVAFQGVAGDVKFNGIAGLIVMSVNNTSGVLCIAQGTKFKCTCIGRRVTICMTCADHHLRDL